MDLPAGTPDFVATAIETLKENAASMMKRQTNSGSSVGMASAAGYFLAVTEFEEMLDTHAKLEAGERQAKAKEVVERHQREQSGEPS